MKPINNALLRNSMTSYVKNNVWWVLPPISALLLAASISQAVAVIAVTVASALGESAFVWHILRTHAFRERAAASSQLALFVLFVGMSLLFAERMAFALPIIAIGASVLVYFNYSLRYIQQYPDTLVLAIARDGFRLVAYTSLFFCMIVFFASIFYFHIETAISVFPLLAFPFFIVLCDQCVQGISMRWSLIQASAFALIALEAVAVLLWLPLSYSAAAASMLLIYFLYCEYVLGASREEGPHQSDRTLSFLLVCVMVVLILLTNTYR